MKEEIAKEWVKALRSGKYKKEIMRLQKEDRFCCLGVLCMLAPPEHRNLSEDGSLKGSGLGTQPLVRKWARISKYPRVPKEIEGSGYLAFLNDHGLSFKKIADLIEKHWEEL